MECINSWFERNDKERINHEDEKLLQQWLLRIALKCCSTPIILKRSGEVT